MKIISNTLEIELERWEDPGDYPSNAGSGPLPSYDYVENIDGQLVIEFTIQDLVNSEEGFDSKWVKNWLEDNSLDEDTDIWSLKVKKWHIDKIEDMIVTLSVDDFECNAPERDYSDYED